MFATQTSSTCDTILRGDLRYEFAFFEQVNTFQYIIAKGASHSRTEETPTRYILMK